MIKYVYHLILLCCFLPALTSYGGTIGVQPTFQPGEEITDGVRLRYKMRVNSNESRTVMLVVQGLVFPKCVNRMF